MRLILSIVFCLLGSQMVHAGLVFNVEQRTQGPIVLGNTAIFDVSVSTDAAAGTISNFGGVTFFLTADDPGAVGGQTTGGRLTFATNDPAHPVAGGRTYLFQPGEGAFSNQGESFMVYSASGTNRTLGTAGGFLGSFILDTTGATIGNHTMGFTQLDAIDAGANTLPGPFSGAPVNYVIGVPEPSSLLLTGCTFAVMGFRVRRRFNPHAKLITFRTSS
jgi:hypothetical protein